MEGPPGSPASTEELFTLPLGPAVAAFLFLSAIAHFVVAGPGWGKYRRTWRRIGTSSAGSVLAQLVADDRADRDDHRHRRHRRARGPFGVNTAMILFGWLQERYEEPGSGRWWPFVFGCVPGIVPWVAIGIYLIGPTAEEPGFVYAIFVSLFVFFNSFAIDQLLQYRRPLAGLPLRRGRLRGAQPGRQVGAGLAGVRQHARST